MSIQKTLMCTFPFVVDRYRRDVILPFLKINLYTHVLPTSVHTARLICGFLIVVSGSGRETNMNYQEINLSVVFSCSINIDQNKDYLSFVFAIWVWGREVFTNWLKSAYILVLSPTLIQTTGRGEVIVIPN